MNIKRYKQELDKHDWYYDKSDDIRRYDSGKASEDNLKKLAEGKKTYILAYQRKYRKMFPKTKTK